MTERAFKLGPFDLVKLTGKDAEPWGYPACSNCGVEGYGSCNCTDPPTPFLYHPIIKMIPLDDSPCFDSEAHFWIEYGISQLNLDPVELLKNLLDSAPQQDKMKLEKFLEDKRKEESLQQLAELRKQCEEECGLTPVTAQPNDMGQSLLVVLKRDGKYHCHHYSLTLNGTWEAFFDLKDVDADETIKWMTLNTLTSLENRLKEYKT